MGRSNSDKLLIEPSEIFIPNYFIDILSEPSLLPDLSWELLRVFTCERKVTAGMEVQ